MARKFETADIVAPVKARLSKRSLTHINTAFDDLGEDLVMSLIGTYTTNDVIILYGCEVEVSSGSIPGTGTATLTAGAIFYNGRVYKVDANASLSTTNPQTLIWQIAETTIAGDPATFDDGNTYDFHIIEKFELVAGTSGAGLADYDDSTVKYKSYTSITGGGGVYLALDGKTVHLSFTYNCGNKTNGQTIYTIPAEFRTGSARTLGISLVTYQAGAGAAQEGHCIPASITTNTGLIVASQDMAASHDTVVGSISYLLD